MTAVRTQLANLPWTANRMIRFLRDSDLSNVAWWSDLEWAYLNCPDDMFINVRQKLVGRDGHFDGGIWELYLWKLFHDAGAEVNYEVNVSALGKQCDFEVCFPNGQPILVEATTISHEPTSIHTKWHEDDLRSALVDGVVAPGYYISTRVERATPTAPSFTEIAAKVQQWVSRFVDQRIEETDDLVLTDPAGWSLTFSAHLLPSGHAHAFTGSVTFPDDADRLRTALERKLKKFEGFSGKPVVIAVSLNSEWWRSRTFDRFSALVAKPAISIDRQTLEASPSLTDPWAGLYNETYSRGVSGILFGGGDFPGFSSSSPLDLWLNYTAALQLDEVSFPIAHQYHRVTENQFFGLDRDGSGNWEPRSIP